MKELLQRIKALKAKVGIIGAGYVGLPLAVAADKAGYDVVVYDTDRDKIAELKVDRSYIPDVSERDLREGGLTATWDPADLMFSDVIIICVPTPLRKTGDPDVSYIEKAVEMVSELAGAYPEPGKRGERLVILESTTYPGYTREQVAAVMDKRTYVAFSPERVDPGNKQFRTISTPKVVGGCTEAATDLAATFYEQFIHEVVTVSSADTAEMVKLLENTFRAVNIALVNEMALMCGKLGLDIWEVIEAAATKPFGFMKFTPGPGLGGHCLPCDPQYLAWRLRGLKYHARFIDLAEQINGAMPQRVVELVAEGLNGQGKAVSGSKVHIMGVAYKPNVGDTRESPAIDIIHLLRQRGALVTFEDPHVEELAVGQGQALRHETSPAPDSPLWLSTVDCVVIVTDHEEYYDMAERICRDAKLVIDTRNVTKDCRAGLKARS